MTDPNDCTLFAHLDERQACALAAQINQSLRCTKEDLEAVFNSREFIAFKFIIAQRLNLVYRRIEGDIEQLPEASLRALCHELRTLKWLYSMPGRMMDAAEKHPPSHSPDEITGQQKIEQMLRELLS